VLQEPLAVLIADLADAAQMRVAGEVQLRGVVQDQHELLPAHGLAGLLPVGPQDRLHRGLRLIAQAVKPSQFIPIEDLGERLLGVGGDLGRRFHQAPRSPPVAQVGGGEVVLGPHPCVGEDIHDNLVVRPQALPGATVRLS